MIKYLILLKRDILNTVKNNTFIEKDNLNRKEEAKFLVNYLTKRYEVKEGNDSFVLNVNAKWGYGKTFFLNLIKEELKSKNYEVVHFDAWENDFTKEPLLAFFSEINSSLEKYLLAFNQQDRPFLKNIFKSSLPILVSVLTKHLTGMGIEQLNDLINEEEKNSSNHLQIQNDTKNTLSSIMSKTIELALKEHNTIKKSIQEFKENMNTLLSLIKEAGKELPLFILIDELDRCRPNYAIELLENIKHIFNIPGIYFIVATNSKQLSHSINAIYGANFSSQKYLKRFFHQEYNLKEPDEYEFIKFLFDRDIHDTDILLNGLLEENYPDKDLNIVMIHTFSKYFDLTLRDIEQCINTLSIIIITWDKNNGQIILPYLLFFIMAKQNHNEIFEEQKKGYNYQQLHEYENKISNKGLFFESLEEDSSHWKPQSKEVNISNIISTIDSFIKTPNPYSSFSTYLMNNIIHNNSTNSLTLVNYPNLVESAAQLK